MREKKERERIDVRRKVRETEGKLKMDEYVGWEVKVSVRSKGREPRGCEGRKRESESK